MISLVGSTKRTTKPAIWVLAALFVTAAVGCSGVARADSDTPLAMPTAKLSDTNPQDVQSTVQRMMQERYRPETSQPAPRRRLPDVPPQVAPLAIPERAERSPSSEVRIWGKSVSSVSDSQFASRTQQQMRELEDVKSSAARLAQEKVGDYASRPRRLEPLTDLLPKPFVPDSYVAQQPSTVLPPAIKGEKVTAPSVPPAAMAEAKPPVDEKVAPTAHLASQPAPQLAVAPPVSSTVPVSTPPASPLPVSTPIAAAPLAAAALEAAPVVPAKQTPPLQTLPEVKNAPVPASLAQDKAQEAPKDQLKEINFGQVAASAFGKTSPSQPQIPLPPSPQKNTVDAKASMLVAPDVPAKGQDSVAMIGSNSDLDFIKKLVGNNGIIAMDVANGSAPPDVQDAVRLEEAVAFALKNNFEIQASSEKSRGSYWDKMGAYAQYVPSVEMSYSYGAEYSAPTSINDQNGDRLLNNTHHRRDRNMSVRQPLVDLSILADIRTGIDKEDIAKIDEIDVREGIASDTVNVFLKLMQSRIAVRLAEQYKHYLDDLAGRMEARVAGGGGTSADLDRIRSRATVAESAKVEATGEYESSLTEFRRLTKIVPAQLSVPDVLAPVVPVSADEALAAAIKGNPSYLSSIKKIDVAADDRNKSISTMLPKLSLQYQKNFSYNAGASAQGNPTDGVYPNQLTQSVMLVAQWSLNSGTPITSTLSSMAKKREMRFRADDTRVRLEQSLRAAFTAVNAANQREEIVRKSVEANERVVTGFEDQYRQGGRSLFELLDAYEQLYNSRLNLLRLIVAKAQAMYQIRKQMGELIPTVAKQARQ